MAYFRPLSSAPRGLSVADIIMHNGLRSGLAADQGPFEVGDEIIGVFDPDRQPDGAGGDR
jgi:hypothetical protein